MGSLNPNGSVIAKDTNSYRNIGNAIQRIDPVSPNLKELIVKDFAPAELGTRPDETVSQEATLGSSSHIKKTNSIDDSLSGLIIDNTLVLASEQPELQLKSITQRSNTHTGERVVIREETPGTLIARQRSEGAFG